MTSPTASRTLSPMRVPRLVSVSHLRACSPSRTAGVALPRRAPRVFHSRSRFGGPLGTRSRLANRLPDAGGRYCFDRAHAHGTVSGRRNVLLEITSEEGHGLQDRSCERSPFADEFRRNPIGSHSSRTDARAFDPARRPQRQPGHPRLPQAVCQMDARRDAASATGPDSFEDDMAFGSREEAEWEVFRRRWFAETGENLNLSLCD